MRWLPHPCENREPLRQSAGVPACLQRGGKGSGAVAEEGTRRSGM